MSLNPHSRARAVGGERLRRKLSIFESPWQHEHRPAQTPVDRTQRAQQAWRTCSTSQNREQVPSPCQKPKRIAFLKSDQEREKAVRPRGQPCFVRGGRTVMQQGVPAAEGPRIRAAQMGRTERDREPSTRPCSHTRQRTLVPEEPRQRVPSAALGSPGTTWQVPREEN